MAKQKNVNDLIFEAINNDALPELEKLFDKTDRGGQLKYLLKSNKLGEKPLALAIKLKRYEIIDKLVKLHRDCSRNGLCNLLCLPTLCRIRINQISVMEMMDYLLDPWRIETGIKNNEPSWLEFLFFSVRISSLTPAEKISASELIGSAFIFNQSFGEGKTFFSEHGISRWKIAMADRKFHAIPKIPYELSDVARKAFGGKTEWQQLEELEQFKRGAITDANMPIWRIASPEWHFQMRIQALLVIHRMACQVNPGRDARPYYFHLFHLFRLGVECDSKRNDFNQAINICFLILEQSNGLNPATTSPKCVNIFVEALNLLTKCFKNVEERGETTSEELSTTNILMAIKYCPAIVSLISASSTKDKDHNLDQVKLFVYDFVLLLVSAHQQLSQIENPQLEENLSLYVQHSVHQGSCLLLHAAVEKSVWTRGNLGQDVIQLFLRAGVNPNATNEEGKTPLHILAEKWTRLSSSDWEQFPTQKFSNFFQSLVNAGGQLDRATVDGETVLSILNENRNKGSLRFDPYLNSLTNN